MNSSSELLEGRKEILIGEVDTHERKFSISHGPEGDLEVGEGQLDKKRQRVPKTLLVGSTPHKLEFKPIGFVNSLRRLGQPGGGFGVSMANAHLNAWHEKRLDNEAEMLQLLLSGYFDGNNDLTASKWALGSIVKGDIRVDKSSSTLFSRFATRENGPRIEMELPGRLVRELQMANLDDG